MAARQGRVGHFGFLTSWARSAFAYKNQRGHLDKHKPNFEERQAARRLFAVLPNTEVFFEQERVAKDDEGSEPEGFKLVFCVSLPQQQTEPLPNTKRPGGVGVTHFDSRVTSMFLPKVILRSCRRHI